MGIHVPPATANGQVAKSYSRNELEALNLCETPIYIFDMERKAMWWGNSAACHLWNADTLEALITRNFSEDMSDTIRQRIDDQFAQMLKGEVLHEQWTFYPSGREPVQVSQSLKAIRIQDEEKHDGDNIKRYAALVECDQPALGARVSSDVVRGVELLRHLPVPVCQFDIDGKLQFQNPQSSKLFGNEEENADFLSMFVDESLGWRILERVKNGDDYSEEAELKTTQGERWFSISVRRRRDPIDSKLVILYSARDITEVMEAREEKHQAILKSEFIAVMAHEIRTPLHQVIGSVELLFLTALDAKQSELMMITRASTNLLMAIINDLLDYTKLEEGKVELEQISFELRGVVRSCMEAVSQKAISKSVQLEQDVENSIPHKLVGDPNRLRQVLLNLLQNAVKFTEEGSIRVTVRPVDSGNGGSPRLRFEVKDSGIGIEESQQVVIFEKYQQANITITRKYGGTGLGLAICKALVELMGGNIELSSEPGVGTTFSFELPFSAARVDMRPSFERMTSDVNVSSLKILVVEDNKINQKVLIKMLERLGHDCFVAGNGQIAIEKLEQCNSTVDLVLMDVQMPVMDGVEATKVIRKQGKDKADLPIVGLTASYQHSDLQYYQDIGMNFCIGKPIRMKQLKETIKMCKQEPLLSLP